MEWIWKTNKDKYLTNSWVGFEWEKYRLETIYAVLLNKKFEKFVIYHLYDLSWAKIQRPHRDGPAW